MERGLELLRADNKSGYSYVFPTGAKWQAKVYARPGPKGQRGLGSFDSQKQAAEQVLSWVLGLVGTPPTPTKEINARGMGKTPSRQVPWCGPPARALFPAPCSLACSLTRRWARTIQIETTGRVQAVPARYGKRAGQKAGGGPRGEPQEAKGAASDAPKG